MINFQELQLVVNEEYSFVGIEKRNSQLKFCLPRGFNPNSFTTYSSKRDLFFLLYKVLGQFKKICGENVDLQKSNDRDGVIQSIGSSQKINLPGTEDEKVNIFYSKLDDIGNILANYDEIKILSLAYRLGLSEEIDYSKIHCFLHQAVYLSDGTVYIDAISLPRQQILYQATDIVAMYCYILWEIKQQLNEEISSEIQALAEEFSHKYIGTEYSLFHEEYSILTVGILKDALELIEHHTPFKDVDYWQLHDAIELFLYGDLSELNEGEIWGIKNFYSVWESMCLTYLVESIAPEFILYLDSTYLANEMVAQVNNQPKIIDLDGAFIINNRKLVPDIVIYSNPFTNKFVITNFHIKQDDWDDYSYQASFSSELDYFKQYYLKSKIPFKIVHEAQERDKKHTFTELEKFYQKQGSNLIISSQLPPQFYSYWDYEILDRLDEEVFFLMQRLNHIFYLAIKFNKCTSDSFQEFLHSIEKRFDCSSNSYTSFGYSLQRGFTEKELILKFNTFLEAISPFIKIIDIKYLTEDYFFSSGNSRDIKERSIRKQFVYEYLLQQHFEGKNLEIKSYFWLPYYSSSSTAIEQNLDYFNGYINLQKINFASIIEKYIF